MTNRSPEWSVSFRLFDKLIEEIHAEAKVWDDEAPHSGEADYYYGRAQGLNQAIQIIENFKKEVES